MTEPLDLPSGTNATIAAPKPPSLELASAYSSQLFNAPNLTGSIVAPKPVALEVDSPDRSALVVPVLKGPKGNTGPKGEPGNAFGVVAWWSGHGSPNDPENSVEGAKVGDYYTDLDTGIVYKLGD